ncbi:MAG: hypothetical protein JWN08_1850 [Frankiales bacterium]|nr:hypothetical protein [Frankiales bacterium]
MTASQIVLLIVVLVVVAVIIGAVLAAVRKRKRSEQLRGTFGSEYDRTVESSDKKRDAERELAERQERHAQLDVRPLPEASRQRYLTAWDGVQNRFVDSPVLALSEADALLTRLLDERGFPTDDVRTQADMLSVEHAHVLEQFRAGHRIEQQNSTGHADTEQVRQGMLHFRSVFEELVSEGAREATPYPQDRPQQVRDQDVRRERDVRTD